MSGNLKNLIRREIKARQDLIGTVVSDRVLSVFDQTVSGSPVWTCTVDIGSNRLLETVPIRAVGAAGMTYADRGRTVLLRRNAQGRYEITGPGDHVSGVLTTKQYDLGTGAETATADRGFSSAAVAFEYYQGPTPPTPGTSLWADGGTPFPLVQTLDADGNPV